MVLVWSLVPKKNISCQEYCVMDTGEYVIVVIAYFALYVVVTVVAVFGSPRHYIHRKAAKTPNPDCTR